MFKTIIAAAVMAGGLIIGSTASAAVTTTVTCADSSVTNGPNTTLYRYSLTLEAPSTSMCFFSDAGGNEGNDQSNTEFQQALTDTFGSGYSILSKYDTGTGGLTVGTTYESELADMSDNTFANVDFSTLEDIIVVFKQDNSFGAFKLSGDIFTGNWMLEISKNGGAFENKPGSSHISLYARMPQVPLPAGGLLLLTALAGAGVVARRRKTA